ncbi:copper amine oxidase N-terminal domain-containing protein [Paenibacillus aestuarii]|uniref:Copper amine oxidase N-terminal domain-containing protein n=1 Tax=Paenibacillus aestuarii TaxID=516965 RepID=A0ABW0KCE7_9BACL|nr:copper amine oxidase N-terminal domain-containing protein [Paenibacillus aestuarii]
MQIGSKNASVNGVITVFDTTPTLIDNATYVPLTYVAESLGSKMEWDDASKSVRIVDPKATGLKQ